jgi:hypothetical protein
MLTGADVGMAGASQRITGAPLWVWPAPVSVVRRADTGMARAGQGIKGE